MDGTLAIAANNLTSPIILFFILGVAAAFARSDLSIPEAVAKGLSIYLLLPLGSKVGSALPGLVLTLHPFCHCLPAPFFRLRLPLSPSLCPAALPVCRSRTRQPWPDLTALFLS